MSGIKCAALSLKRAHDVHGRDGFSSGVLSVNDGVVKDVFEIRPEDIAYFVVYETRDALNTTAARETANGGLGDALNVVAKNLSVAFWDDSLSECFSLFSLSRHDDVLLPGSSCSGGNAFIFSPQVYGLQI